MSMALWASYRLDDGTTIFDESDKFQMLQYIEELDALCETLGLSLLSDMVDASEAAEDMFDDDDILDDEDMGTLENIGVSSENYDDETWVHPRDALFLIDILYCHLSNDTDQLDIPAAHVEELLEELRECLDAAQTALEHSEHFRLGLIA